MWSIDLKVICCNKRFTSLCKNLFNSLDFSVEALRCASFSGSAKNSNKSNKFLHNEGNLLIQHIIVQDQDGQNNNIKSHVLNTNGKVKLKNIITFSGYLPSSHLQIDLKSLSFKIFVWCHHSSSVTLQTNVNKSLRNVELVARNHIFPYYLISEE